MRPLHLEVAWSKSTAWQARRSRRRQGCRRRRGWAGHRVYVRNTPLLMDPVVVQPAIWSLPSRRWGDLGTHQHVGVSVFGAGALQQRRLYFRSERLNTLSISSARQTRQSTRRTLFPKCFSWSSAGSNPFAIVPAAVFPPSKASYGQCLIPRLREARRSACVEQSER